MRFLAGIVMSGKPFPIVLGGLLCIAVTERGRLGRFDTLELTPLLALLSR
ncbi:MAG TPA: hypothetical protein VL475_00880 [Planctomycetaceae bacterium]|jgi:hypothetical protein|nr:hypothetical protein [Planctomycetaceae bacterium]